MAYITQTPVYIEILRKLHRPGSGRDAGRGPEVPGARADRRRPGGVAAAPAGPGGPRATPRGASKNTYIVSKNVLLTI